MIHSEARIGERVKIWHPELSNIGKCVIGDECTIHSHVWIGDDVVIGNRVRIQAFTFIPSLVVICDEVFVGPRVTFTNDPKMLMQPGTDHWKATIIQRGAKLGAGVMILAGVTIGAGAILGMGAVVRKSVGPGEVWVGNPAKRIR